MSIPTTLIQPTSLSIILVKYLILVEAEAAAALSRRPSRNSRWNSLIGGKRPDGSPAGPPV